MGNGRKGIAPCGHPGEAVIGQYYQCPKCDVNKLDYTPDWEIKTLEITKCPNCGSFDVDEDFQLDPMFYFFNPGVSQLNKRCENCGHCWFKI